MRLMRGTSCLESGFWRNIVEISMDHGGLHIPKNSGKSQTVKGWLARLSADSSVVVSDGSPASSLEGKTGVMRA